MRQLWVVALQSACAWGRVAAVRVRRAAVLLWCWLTVECVACKIELLDEPQSAGPRGWQRASEVAPVQVDRREVVPGGQVLESCARACSTTSFERQLNT